MSDFLNFELEDLSSAFEIGFNEEDLVNAAEGLELGYQEDDAPGSRLVEQRLHRHSFAQSELSCGDSNTIYQPRGIQFDHSRINDSQVSSVKPLSPEYAIALPRKRFLSEEETLHETTHTQKMMKTVSDESQNVMAECGEQMDSTQTKERKCLREKQRRAELNTAFSSLAKSLSLPVKCNKTLVIQKAESTILALRKQVSELIAGKMQNTQLMHPAPVNKTPGKLPPWIIAPLLQNVHKISEKQSEKPKSGAVIVPDTSNTSILDQMKATVQNMQRLYEKYEKESRNVSSNEEITHSHCA